MKTKKISKKVKFFYEKHPFLFYSLNKIESKTDLYNKASSFAKLLDKNIPIKKSILDLGCGTGQLAAFLSIKKRNVIGVDFSKTSIRYANRLKKKINLDNVKFIQNDIFNLNLPEESFDYTLCLGVLHHTTDPYRGFQIQCNLTKKGGFVVLGLYNTCGRLVSKLRKLFFKLSRNKEKMEFFMRRKDADEKEKRIWFVDQYQHPHELTYTIDGVLEWFKKNNIEFINAIPKFELFTDLSLDEKLFESYSNNDEHNKRFLHLLVQLEWIITRSRDGGFFIVIGKKK